MVHLTIKYALSLLMISALFSSCYYDVESELYPVPGGNDSCAKADVTYNNGIKQITDTKCAVSGCHVAGGSVIDLSTYAGVKTIADNGRLNQRVIIEKTMPPSGPLPPCEITLIKTWLDKGAPEN